MIDLHFRDVSMHQVLSSNLVGFGEVTYFLVWQQSLIYFRLYGA